MALIKSTTSWPGAHIAINGVSHHYRRSTVNVLSDISLEVQPCEAVALVGRSGCGKSTLLHIISGLALPSAGEVRIDGARVEGPSPHWIVMFQQPNLYPWMTVAQNVGIGLKFAGRPRREIAARVSELLQLVELDGYAARNVQDLSGGQQQRIALARSLAVCPKVLLLDEPFSALDGVTRRALQRDVRRIAVEMGITLVIVTHDIPEAVAMADRAVIMTADPGRIAEIVPIEGDHQDRERRGTGAQAAQIKLQAAFERAAGRSVEAPVSLLAAHSAQPDCSVQQAHRPEPLKIVTAGHR
ncbi:MULTISPECIES: ABC transporter ATP-binding protein [Rhodopseudomonas]|uniref:ABC transporter n=1 Tax=Rhodopseudomonas palustris TaxID=1076 RepID=A0A0D7F4S1_RHOPL|nr:MULTISPECIES: ABC transporter ATP-binding protein [Rhodopseudomonas]KIZ48129.1 ABC transporter [Rhodopseudomonas palustris]WOK17276.1 ABC transporter ATP-binding protein [Rhodopseudomonas sp. BAL398]